MAKKANKIVLCDSNILIAHLRNNRTVTQQLVSIGKGNLFISIITYGEVLIGARKGEITKTKRLLSQFHIIELDTEISFRLRAIFNEAYFYEQLMADSIIAATALVYGLPVWTKKDFSYVKGIKFYKP